MNNNTSDNDNQQTDPINREAERARIQGSDTGANPLEGGGEGSAVGPTGQSTADHKIRASQNESTSDIATQRRDVVATTMNAEGAPSPSEPARDPGAGERYAQMDDGASREGDSEYQPSRNTGDKAAPVNQGTGGDTE